MSDALSSINNVMKEAGIEVLDLSAFVQFKCSCGGYHVLDLSTTKCDCSCGIGFILQLSFAATQ